MTLNLRLATRAFSCAISAGVSGDFDTINVARKLDPAMNIWSSGRATPSSRKAAAARLISRPVSVISLGLNQRDTVNTPVGVNAERKWCQPWVVYNPFSDRE